MGDAAATTLGGLVAMTGFFPAIAAVAPVVVPVGIGLAVLGWSANLIGQGLNGEEGRREVSEEGLTDC